MQNVTRHVNKAFTRVPRSLVLIGVSNDKETARHTMRDAAKGLFAARSWKIAMVIKWRIRLFYCEYG